MLRFNNELERSPYLTCVVRAGLLHGHFCPQFVPRSQRAAHAAPATPAFRGQAITDAHLERYAYHQVDPVALHFEDPVDRLRREEPDAIDLAAAGHRRLEGATGAGIAVTVARGDVGAQPALGQVVSALMVRLVIALNATLMGSSCIRSAGAAGGGTTLATRWNSVGGRPVAPVNRASSPLPLPSGQIEAASADLVIGSAEAFLFTTAVNMPRRSAAESR